MSITENTEKPNALEVEMTSAKCQEYVNRYRGFAKASAENFIQLAKLVQEAEKKLRKSDMAVFCFHVGLERGGSTYRKLIQIAENADRLLPHLLSLPPAWTTLYDLTKLSHGEFNKVVESGVISPNMTAKDVQAVVPKPKKSKAKAAEEAIDENPNIKKRPSTPKPAAELEVTPDFTIAVDLAESSEAVRRKVHDSIQAMSRDLTFPMTVGGDLVAAIKKSVEEDDDDPMKYFKQLAAEV